MIRPWHDRSNELEATEGTYADFGAWREWIHARDEDGVIEYDDVFLYALFCAAVDAAKCEKCDSGEANAG